MTPRPLELAVEASFEQLSVAVPAKIGLAISRPDRTYWLGQWSSGVAWSTIKVPLTMAVLRSDGSRTVRDLAVKAITESDNPASEELWSQLGNPTDAARKVQLIISQCGDAATEVQSRRLRPGFSAFGQTQWTLERQACFAARLPSIPDGATVIDLMHDVTVSQRWGLAAKGFAAKAGWGPGVHGDYLVRQFAIVPTQSGQWGVALAAEADDGVFETGVEVVDALSDWFVSRLPVLARY
jgi:hypothetical protein